MTGLRFIFMLTRNDRTVADARDHVQTAIAAGVRHIGFKDVGLERGQLRKLSQAIQSGGARSYLEIVSLDEQSELDSVRVAVDIGVNTLLGGTRVSLVAPLLADTAIEYFPFAGRVSGHPSVLEGTPEEIADNAATIAERSDVDGLNLLAYRSTGDVPALMRAVCMATSKPVIIAGSIDSTERIAAVKAAGATGFTIGKAAMDGEYTGQAGDLSTELVAIMRDVGHHDSFN